MKHCGILILLAFLATANLRASIPDTTKVVKRPATRRSLFWLDFGLGFPQLPSLEFAYRPLNSWQLGVSYGLIPGGGSGGSVSPNFKLSSQNEVLSNGTFVTFNEPTITSTMYSLCPFVRFYPNPTNFYVQLTLALLTVNNKISSTISDVNGNLIAGADVQGNIKVVQFLPTVSIGHVFATEIFFFNVNMGATIVATATTTSTITGTIPDALGGTSGNQSALSDVDEKSKAAIAKATEEFRKQVLFLPSIHLTFGFMF